MPDVEWTAVVLPDTQVYAARYPHHFEAQTRWVREQAALQDIAFVLHAGDVTDDNSAAHWDVAERAMAHLDGRVPYVLALGNHDYGERGAADARTSGAHTRFPLGRVGTPSSLIAAFEPGLPDNAVHRFNTPTGPWLVAVLEFGPRDAVVEWARGVLAAHENVPAIVLTHAYLYSDHTRYDHASRPDQKWSPHFYGVAKLAGGVNDGEALYTKLIEPSANVRFVLSGHVLNEGAAHRRDVRADGSVVHQLLANYQHGQEGGAAFLRLLRFSNGGRRVRVETYSPHLRTHKKDGRNAFELAL